MLALAALVVRPGLVDAHGASGQASLTLLDLPLGLPDDLEAATAILAAEDQRRLTGDLDELTRAGDNAVRARAALAFGHVGLPAGYPRLLELTRDRDAATRALAAFGLGLLELDLEPRTAAANATRITGGLVGLLGDPEPLVVAQALWALGARADDGAGAAVADVLDDATRPPEVLRAALDAWWRLPGASPRAIDRHLAAVDAGVRRAAAGALRRIADPNSLPVLADALDDEDVGVRVAAMRGLHAAPPATVRRHLTAMLEDEDWRIVCAALDWAAAQWRADVEIGDDVFTAALTASGNRNRHVQRRALAALAAAPAKYSVVVDRLDVALRSGDGAMRLAAVEALGSEPDRARRGIGTLLEVYGLDAPPRDASAAAIPAALAATPSEAAAVVRVLAMSGDDDAGAWLRVLASYGPAAARAEALRQLRRTAPDEAASSALALLAAGEPPLRAVAGEVVAELAAAGDLPRSEGGGSPWFEALWTAQREMGTAEALEPRLVLLDALLLLDPQEMRLRAAALLPDDDRVVRTWALRELGSPQRRAADRLAAAIAPVDSGRSATDYRRLAERVLRLQEQPPLLDIETPRGTFVWQLRADWAPLAALSYLDRVESGFYDDLVFHRVVADFVIQTGDPSAIGYGGAPGSLRSEETPIPYEGGVVGLALAGRDTGGSQFFVVHSEQPHLTGRYPVLGRIVENGRFVARIQPGDAVRIRARTGSNEPVRVVGGAPRRSLAR